MPDYNGWTNHATWSVINRNNPETLADLDNIKWDLEEQVDALPQGLLRDIASCEIELINWQELRDHMEPEEEEEDEEEPEEMTMEQYISENTFRV